MPWSQRALGEQLSQGAHKQKLCSSKANPIKRGGGGGAQGSGGILGHSTMWGPPVMLSLSLPAGPATVAKDGAEAPCPSSLRGAAGSGPAGPHLPAPTAGLHPPPAASILPTRPLVGGGRPPVQGTSPQPKAPRTPHSPAAGPPPWPGQEAAAVGAGGCSPVALRRRPPEDAAAGWRAGGLQDPRPSPRASPASGAAGLGGCQGGRLASHPGEGLLGRALRAHQAPRGPLRGAGLPPGQGAGAEPQPACRGPALHQPPPALQLHRWLPATHHLVGARPSAPGGRQQRPELLRPGVATVPGDAAAPQTDTGRQGRPLLQHRARRVEPPGPLRLSAPGRAGAMEESTGPAGCAAQVSLHPHLPCRTVVSFSSVGLLRLQFLGMYFSSLASREQQSFVQKQFGPSMGRAWDLQRKHRQVLDAASPLSCAQAFSWHGSVGSALHGCQQWLGMGHP